jgi:GNAT superfamily N-acetyltransferase
MNWVIHPDIIYFKINGKQLGTITYGVDNEVAHLHFIDVCKPYRGRGYGYKQLDVLVTHLDNLGVRTLHLDDVSGRSSIYAPKSTRSGGVYEGGLSLYTKLGCTSGDWGDGPERVCNIGTMKERLQRLLYIIKAYGIS